MPHILWENTELLASVETFSTNTFTVLVDELYSCSLTVGCENQSRTDVLSKLKDRILSGDSMVLQALSRMRYFVKDDGVEHLLSRQL